MTEGGYQPFDEHSHNVAEELEGGHPSEKGPHAFRTISEVADELHVPQHVLRFWETRFEQVRPLKRGGGRRYYRPTDIELLRSIAYLLYEKNYTVKGVQKILAEKSQQTGGSLQELAPAACEASVPVAPSYSEVQPVEGEHAHVASESETLEETVQPEVSCELELGAPVIIEQADVQADNTALSLAEFDSTPLSEEAYEVPSVATSLPTATGAEQPTGYEFMQLGHVVEQSAHVVSPEMNAWQRLAAETDQAVRVDEVISISENMIVKSGVPKAEFVQHDAKLVQANARLRHDLQDILVELEALRARLSA